MYLGQLTRKSYVKAYQNITHDGMSAIEIVECQQEQYILKLCNTNNDTSILRFPQELKIHQKLNNLSIGQDGIVPLIEPIQKPLGFVMHYIAYGFDLADWYAREKESNPENSHRIALELLWRMTRLISELHKSQVIHNDIKPQNFLICNTHNGFKIYILDFGIARFVWERLSARGGTPGYTALECFDDINLGDESSDIFSVIISWLSAVFPNLGFEDIDNKEEWSQFLNDFHFPDHPILFPELVNLLASMVCQKHQRKFRTSQEFFSALSDCLFFGGQTHAHLELVANQKLLGWHPHIVTHQSVPSFFHKSNLPVFFTDIFQINCQHFQAVRVQMSWRNSANNGAAFLSSSHVFENDCPIQWVIPQKQAYVDIYPINHTQYPSQRIFFPSHTIPAHLKIEPLLSFYENKLIWYGVDCGSQTYIQIYQYSTTSFHQLQSTMDGRLYEPIVLTSAYVYLIWDSALLRLVEAFQYIDRQGKFLSVFSDPQLKPNLPNLQNHILNRWSIPLASTSLLPITEETQNRVQQFEKLLSQTSLQFLGQYFLKGKYVYDLWNYIGILYQLIDHPLYEGSQAKQWNHLLWHCLHYKIQAHNLWLLQFFNHSKRSMIPLYAGRTVQNHHEISSGHDKYWDSHSNTSLFSLKSGAKSSRFSLHYLMDGVAVVANIFDDETLCVGRWNTVNPPHLPVPLSPLMSEEIVHIGTEVRVSSHSQNFVQVSPQTIQIVDKLSQSVCTKCGLIQERNHRMMCAYQPNPNHYCRAPIQNNTAVLQYAVRYQFHQTTSGQGCSISLSGESWRYEAISKRFYIYDGILIEKDQHDVWIVSDYPIEINDIEFGWKTLPKQEKYLLMRIKEIRNQYAQSIIVFI